MNTFFDNEEFEFERSRLFYGKEFSIKNGKSFGPTASGVVPFFRWGYKAEIFVMSEGEKPLVKAREAGFILNPYFIVTDEGGQELARIRRQNIKSVFTPGIYILKLAGREIGRVRERFRENILGNLTNFLQPYYAYDLEVAGLKMGEISVEVSIEKYFKKIRLAPGASKNFDPRLALMVAIMIQTQERRS